MVERCLVEDCRTVGVVECYLEEECRCGIERYLEEDCRCGRVLPGGGM